MVEQLLRQVIDEESIRQELDELAID